MDEPPPTMAHEERRRGLAMLAAAALALTAIRLMIAARTGLVDDEAYYRLWSLAPSLSYLDHPPMIAWIIGAGRAIAGDTPLGVRLLAPLIHLAGVAFLWRSAALLYGDRIALTAAWMLLAMPLLSLGGILVTPDLPSVFFAGLAFWALAELDRSQNALWWLAVGAFAGLGLLSKYTNLFFGATILIWVLAVPNNRKWLTSPYLWIGGAMAVLLTLPVVVWNSEHQWASFAKQFGRVTRHADFGPKYLIELAGGYVALASPVIAVLSIAGLAKVTRRGVATRDSSDVLLATAILPMLAYFLMHALHDRVQGNWPAPLYPMLAICAAIAVEEATGAARRRRLLVAGLVVGFSMCAGIFLHALHPLDGQRLAKDPTRQMRGWPQFATELDKKLQATDTVWIATSSYALTGQLAFAMQPKIDVVQLDERLRYVFLPTPPAALLEKAALYVSLRGKSERALLDSRFGKVEPLGIMQRPDGSRTGATYEIFRLSEPLGPVLPPR